MCGAGAKFLNSKMATHFEVFGKLRSLGKSLDEISSSLPADGDAEDTNRARACLQLKALLTEAKIFKVFVLVPPVTLYCT